MSVNINPHNLEDDLCSRENSKIPETHISQYQSGLPGVGVFPFGALDLHKQESRRCDRHSAPRKYLCYSRQLNQHPDRCKFPGGSVCLLESLLPAHGLASPIDSFTPVPRSVRTKRTAPDLCFWLRSLNRLVECTIEMLSDRSPQASMRPVGCASGAASSRTPRFAGSFKRALALSNANSPIPTADPNR